MQLLSSLSYCIMRFLVSFWSDTVLIHLLYHYVTGEATRKGFYKYDDKRKASPDPEIMKYIEKSRNMAGVTPNPEVLSPFIDLQSCFNFKVD